MMSASKQQPKMWKPGTAAPPAPPSGAGGGRSHNSRTKTPPRSRSPANQGRSSSSSGGKSGRSPTTPVGGGGGGGGVTGGSLSAGKRDSAKKGLSGATMGMRFMKRKAEAADAAKRREQVDAEAKAKAEREQMEWEASQQEGGAAVATGSDGADGGEPMDEDEECMVPQVATASDMYGMGADLVGRRSFGGFNKIVAETWNEALHMRERVGSNAGGQKASDDELLRKYEKIVKGRGGKSDGPPIGNLAEKAKKRRGNAQSGNKEKRKRS